MIDSVFDAAVHRAATVHAAELIASPAEPAKQAPRPLARNAKTLIAVYAASRGTLHGRRELLNEALRHLVGLRALQSPSGFFTGGDNVQSPPDSAFVINDVCDAYAIASGAAPGVRAAGGLTEAAAVELEPVKRQLREIAAAAADALRLGGVHTPNHRWELSAALARLNRSFPDPRLLARAQEWLAEGVDIDVDGFYSERSPNYAVHVSNPSLMLLAEELDREDLWQAVVRSLEATAALAHPDGTVETVQSRRQDQKARFPLAPFLAQFRIMANRTGRGDLACFARLAAGEGIDDSDLLAGALLTPALVDELPAASGESEPETTPRGSERHFTTVNMVVRRAEAADTVLYGGSDVPAQRRVRSGLANNPTFFRMFAGRAVLDSLRLSREFFDLGPFRAEGLSPSGAGGYRLREVLASGFYQPLSGADLSGGDYELEDEGRFSGAMSFSRRSRDRQSLATDIHVTLADDGAELVISTAGAVVPWSLEFDFRPGGTVSGAQPIDTGRWRSPDGVFSYAIDSDAITVTVATDGEGFETRADSGALLYAPGQDYGYLGGTDAGSGERVYVGGLTGGTVRIGIRAERGGAR